MKQDEPALEVEVVEIDGVAVDSQPQREIPEKDRRVDWQSWQGKIRMLDKRWAPLWIVLGFIAVILIVAIGMCVAVFAVAYWMLKTILRAIFSLFMPAQHGLNRRS